MTQQLIKLSDFINHDWDLLRDGDKVVLELCPYERPDRRMVYIETLFSPVRIRGRGYAREAMERLCQAADEHEVELRLAVVSSGPVTNFQLVGFYESLGFELYERNPIMMFRIPNNEDL